MTSELHELSDLAKKATKGHDFDTCAEHLRRMADQNPDAMVCALRIGGKASIAVHVKDDDEMSALFIGMAVMPDMQPHILKAAELILSEILARGEM